MQKTERKKVDVTALLSAVNSGRMTTEEGNRQLRPTGQYLIYLKDRSKWTVGFNL